MRKDDGQIAQGGGGGASRPGRSNGFLPTSLRSLSSYLRIVNSGASSVASTVRTAASAIVDRDNNNNDDATQDQQVLWAGFDKLEFDGDKSPRQVLLLGYRSGFQVWDVEDANNVHELAARHDGPVSFVQMLPKPLASKRPGDKFAEYRPVLAACADRSLPEGGGNIIQDALLLATTPSTSAIYPNIHEAANGSFTPTVVWFYSLKSQSYIHVLKFRSMVCSIRCSSRIVAVAQTTQVHCFDAATLEREYTIVTNPLVTTTGFPVGFGGGGAAGYGPLAVGPRWLAYSGSPVTFSSSGRVNPQSLLTPSASFPGSKSNGSLVAHYAKASSKQLAAGIVTLGDMGYKKLSRYCSELVPDTNNASSVVSGTSRRKVNWTVNGHFGNIENVGMVIVRDIVSKSVIAQFRAHKSPISSLCFDPSGMLLATASVQGHNINVFRIIPRATGCSSRPDVDGSYLHLYRLQRGLTNAVIQDICFSDDSSGIMISTSKGTSHLFTLPPPPSPQSSSARNGGPIITLSAVSRIRSGTNNGWRNTVNSAAAAATGRITSDCGGGGGAAIASTFRLFFSNGASGLHEGLKNHLMVFSPSAGCLIEYALKEISGLESSAAAAAAVAIGFGSSSELQMEETYPAGLAVEAVRKWNICQKQQHMRRRAPQEENIDIYGENGNSYGVKIIPEEMRKACDEEECGGGGGEVGRSRRSLSSISINSSSSNKLKVVSSKEGQHVFMSEAELQMLHDPRVALWTKPEIYFQPMSNNNNNNIIKRHGKDDDDDDDVPLGEIEIERIPFCTIEVRSKDLIPVLDYINQPPKLWHANANAAATTTTRETIERGMEWN
ncbi:autophagy-related protein 18f isoform X2 [Impatiens glandulifera]|uniref:autophagy-related protein 18f isoform X2 n=1 Tax=Impatiens glandulifera TaxID=253017 RepID=UPI001FB09493|nr:autophagy-related protein 18f isoform X2 [Impatiens glandulifera]